MKKIISKALALLFVVGLCSGCSGDKTVSVTKKYKAPDSFNSSVDEIIASNDNYTLKWNSEYKRVVLSDNNTGNEWSTTPNDANDNGVDDFGFPIEADPQVNSPITVEYIDPKTNTPQNLIGYTGSVRMGNIDCKAIKNGVCVTYYFEDESIAIPVEYVLRSNGLKISVNPKEIKEGKNKLLSVTLAPFLCSVKNTSSDGYLFVPSGSGSIVYPKISSQNGTSFSSPVYGRDLTMQQYNKLTNTEDIKLPVYGAKNGDTATFIIIENGAECAELVGNMGSETLNYSNIGSKFVMRGYDQRTASVFAGSKSLQSIYADSLISGEVSIGVYPLTGEMADYNGMVKAYQQYLTDNGELKKTEYDKAKLHLKFYGGTNVKKSFLGVPYNSLFCLTSITEAQNISDKIIKNTGASVSVELSGFGDSGLDIEKLAGNYKIASKLGSVKQLKNLQSSLENNKADLYFDFDITGIGKSGNSWSYFGDIAKGPTGLKTYQYGYDRTIRSQDSAIAKYGLLSRNKLIESAQKLIKKTKGFKLSGIGIDSLSYIKYSDYRNIKYYAANNMSTDVKAVIKAMGNKKVLVNNANAYAACLATQITDAPTGSAEYDVFDVNIPFYQMVFCGYKPITSSPINSATDPKDAALSALEGGSGLSYSVIANYDTSLVSSQYRELHQSLYSDIKDEITEAYNSASDFYKSIGNSKIQSYEILSDNMRKTVFENGTLIITNHSEKAEACEYGEIPAKSFIVKEAAK